ncbi:RNA recognition domain containing protein [Babesia ovis]|uniref:RNA recognition domain containing protein n=1 Tax=Babesia ovis TaxID=5869 RepID=A0A9W5TCT6_BABOV|nr:RNA recognition domain containing protein [Babesia ovis]
MPLLASAGLIDTKGTGTVSRGTKRMSSKTVGKSGGNVGEDLDNKNEDDAFFDAAEQVTLKDVCDEAGLLSSVEGVEEKKIYRQVETRTREKRRKVYGTHANVSGKKAAMQKELVYEQTYPIYDDTQQHYDQRDEYVYPADEDKIIAHRIFVSKLSYEATTDDLENYFCQFGNITDVHIPRQPGNPSLNKGYGFVSFDDENSVMEVLETTSHVINGREVMIDRAIGQKYHSSSRASEDGSTQLRDPYARVKRQYEGSGTMYMDPYSKRDRNDSYRTDYYATNRSNYASPMSYAGFDPNKPVNYVFSGAARMANYGIQEYDTRYSGTTQKTRNRVVPKLFIGRLNPDTTVGTLRNYFSHFGEISDAYIPRDTVTQKGKGFGFLTFAHKDSILAVMQPAFKHYIDGREIVVDYADMSTRSN